MVSLNGGNVCMASALKSRILHKLVFVGASLYRQQSFTGSRFAFTFRA